MPSNRQDNADRDARLVNGFIERELQGDVWIYKRPGVQRLFQPTGDVGLAQGVYSWRGDLYTIVNGHLFKNTTDKGGTINTTHGVYRFSSIMGAVPKLVFSNGFQAYQYCDADGLEQWFPKEDATHEVTEWVKGLPYLDGRIYIMDREAFIYGSSENDVESPWALGDNVLAAQIEPSQGVAMAKQGAFVIAFKENSTEVFYDAANAEGSPLGRVQGAKLDYGCISQDSVRSLDGALFWLCTNESASVQVMKMDKLRAEIISTPAIERLLTNADFSLVYSWTLKLGGHRWYAFTLVNNNITLVFDLNTGMWSQWTDVDGNYLPIVDSSYTSNTSQTVLQHATDGWLYTVSMEQLVDDGGGSGSQSHYIPVVIVTPNYDAGTMRNKTLAALFFDASQDSASNLECSWSDDDYQTWSTRRTVDLAQKEPSLRDLGVFRRRAIRLEHAAPTKFRIKSLEFQLDIGKS